MQLRPILPAFLIVTAGVAAFLSRRPTVPVDALGTSAPSSAASAAVAVPVGTGPVEDEGAARSVHGGPARRHRARGHGPSTARVLWRRELGGPIQAQVTASPDAATLYAVTLSGDVVALAAADGSERWRRAQGNRLYAAPTVAADGTLFLGRDGGAVIALSAEGAVKWRFETEHDCDVAVIDRGANGLFAGCGPRAMWLRRDGTLLAEVTLPKKIFSTPAASEAMIVIGAQDGHVRAFEPVSLRPLFDTALGADVDGGIALADDGSIYAGTDAGEVVKLDARGGVLWRRKIGSYVRGALSLARNGDVLAGVMGLEPAQVRLRGDDGELVFRAKTRGTGAQEFGMRGGALEDDAGRLYFGAQDDSVYALSGAGELLFRHETGADVDAPLSLLPDGRLLIASDDGSVTCLAP